MRCIHVCVRVRVLYVHVCIRVRVSVLSRLIHIGLLYLLSDSSHAAVPYLVK